MSKTSTSTSTSSTQTSKAKTEERLTVPPAPAQPLVIHNLTRRNDHDALTGHAVEIEKGEHKGKRGIFEKVDEYQRDGYPKTVIVSLDNVTGLLLSLPYSDIRHIPPGEIRNG